MALSELPLLVRKLIEGEPRCWSVGRIVKPRLIYEYPFRRRTCPDGCWPDDRVRQGLPIFVAQQSTKVPKR